MGPDSGLRSGLPLAPVRRRGRADHGRIRTFLPDHPGKFSGGAAAGGALAGRLAGGPGCHTNRAFRERRWPAAGNASRSSSGGRCSQECPFGSARSILAVGRDLAGEKRRAVAKRVCWAGAPAPNGAPPAAQRPMQSPDRAAIAAAGPPTHSLRLCHLPVQSEPRSPSTPRHCAVLAACPVSLDAPTPASCFARRRRRGRGPRALAAPAANARAAAPPQTRMHMQRQQMYQHQQQNQAHSSRRRAPEIPKPKPQAQDMPQAQGQAQQNQNTRC